MTAHRSNLVDLAVKSLARADVANDAKSKSMYEVERAKAVALLVIGDVLSEYAGPIRGRLEQIGRAIDNPKVVDLAVLDQAAVDELTTTLERVANNIDELFEP